MSKMADLSYQIEQLYIEGHSPKVIAVLADCQVAMVYNWLEDHSLETAADEFMDNQMGESQ